MRIPRLSLQVSDRKVILRLADISIVNGATLLALWLWTLRDPWRTLSREFILSEAHWFIFLTALWVLLASINDFYDLKVASNPLASVLTLVKITLLMLWIYFLIYFFSAPRSLPRVVILFYGISSFTLLGFWRLVYALLLSRPPFQQRAIIVGAGQAGRTIVRAIKENVSQDYQLVGYIDDDPAKQGQIIEGVPVIGTHHNLLTLVKDNDVSEVIIAITHDMQSGTVQAILECREQGVNIVPMAVLYEEITGQVPVEHIGDNWYDALPMAQTSAVSPYRLFKRLMDITFAVIGLILTSPLFPLIFLAIFLDSPGPVLYEQQRVGQGGRPFPLFKFRSMVIGAEEDGKARWASKDDARVTRVGRFLRRTHLDELPQLVNVLKGEMSLVGPRPERPEFVTELEKQIPFYGMRHTVRPGMAGWALVKYGYGNSLEDALVKLQYDLYYIKHQSLYLDLLIILKAIGHMIGFRGT